MKRKSLLLVTSLALFMATAPLAAAPDRLPPRSASSTRLWVRSLGGETPHVTVGRAAPGSKVSKAALAISATEWTEVVRTVVPEELQVGGGKDLVLVHASPRFDITAAEVLPGPAKSVATGSDESGVLRANQHGSLTAERTRGPLPVALALRAPQSSVEVQLRSGGKLVGFVNVSSEKPATLQLDLGSLLDRHLAGQPVLVDVRTLRGEISASSSLGTFRRILAKTFGGNAHFNHDANWQQTSNLYYYIDSAPVSTWGELDTYRNGSWLYSPNWVLTDGTGSATKGPWSWSTTYSDQTDDPAFIRWPDGSTTTSRTHYWDKSCPQITRTSPSGAPPSTYYGTASDTQWGACFSASWPSYLYSTFYDQTAHLYWDPAARGYTSSSPVVVYGTLTGMPSCGVGWNTNFPALSAHTSGHTYLWQTCIVESNDGCAACTNLPFTY